MNEPVILKEAFENFVKYQNCSNCPLQIQCDAAEDILDSPNICNIIRGDYEGFDEYRDNHVSRYEN